MGLVHGIVPTTTTSNYIFDQSYKNFLTTESNNTKIDWLNNNGESIQVSLDCNTTGNSPILSIV